MNEHDKDLFKTKTYCAYCDIPLNLKSGVDMFAVVQMHFAAYAIDGNTGLPTQIQTTDRGLEVHMCPTCFDAFSNHMKDFTAQYKPTLDAASPFVSEELPENQIPKPMVTKTYKAVEGSVRNEAGRLKPPKTSTEGIVEGGIE